MGRPAGITTARAWAARRLALPCLLLLLLLPLFCTLLLAPPAAAGAAADNTAHVVFHNRGSVDVDVFWRHPETKQYTLLATIAQGQGQDINTFAGHEFLMAAAGMGTPPAGSEPNYVQRETGELKYVLRTAWTEGVGGANRVDVDIVPDLPEGHHQQANNASAVKRAASLSSEAPQQVGGRPAAVEASVVVKNNAGSAVGIFWLDEAKGQYIKLTTVEDGKDMTINSFTGHGLLILPLGEEREGMTPASHPPNLRVRGDEVLRVEEDADEEELKLVTESLTPKQDAAAATPVGEKRGLAQQQQQQHPPKRRAPPAPLKKGLAKGQVPAGQTVTLATVQEVIKQCGKDQPACVADALYRARVAAIQKQVQTEMTQRDDVEERYRDFACLNYNTMLPSEYETHTWVYDPASSSEQCTDGEAGAEGSCSTASGTGDQKKWEVRVDHFFDAPGGNARIYLLHDFVDPHECAALKARAGPRLAAAAVTGETPGEKIVSKSRKAKAALVRPDLKDPIDPLAELQRRVFAFVNEYGGGGYEDFQLEGQEPFNVIMYNTTGDEYRVHCDGYCDSSPFMRGGRAATVVVYCEEAERGGQTSFTNADIMVKGKAGQAAFFHYRDADGFMDSGWTRHGGCPVVEGTKWIATQWIRDGVSDQDPWYAFTPTGDRDGPRGFKSSDPNY